MRPPPTPQDDQEQLEQILAQAAKAMRELQEAQTRIGAVTGVGTSADGLVTATSDGHGAIISLKLDPRAMRLDTTALGRHVTMAVQEAQRAAEQQTRDVLSNLPHTQAMPKPLGASLVRERVEEAARRLLG
ncbi:YbaB/EbfC family nucleoid-associated protein [Nonomuraea diastatica]|uniref:YbaB/EbfC family DNA-binding protein n=1 Tax=Nonomuraea diastatica TaxID=1848329 RepID=A0A4R4WS94_9ACTN|nr:YbaB/EbfC family nucleoid-associated protein [Nonomuraea diastatica]TDD20435.1 YbaB/EbfC family DNA-binding protein [Nonomuraea diastatica]